jgi:hypothetical protein
VRNIHRYETISLVCSTASFVDANVHDGCWLLVVTDGKHFQVEERLQPFVDVIQDELKGGHSPSSIVFVAGPIMMWLVILDIV